MSEEKTPSIIESDISKAVMPRNFLADEDVYESGQLNPLADFVSVCLTAPHAKWGQEHRPGSRDLRSA
jgi:hypothetical protein